MCVEVLSLDVLHRNTVRFKTVFLEKSRCLFI